LVPLVVAAIAAVAGCELDRSPTGTAPADSLSGDAFSADLAATAIGAPLPFLTLDQQGLFTRGSVVFQTVFTPATGLGPLFNSISCSECHEAPVAGGGGDELETAATAFHGDGTCDDLAASGGPVIQDSVTPALHDALGIYEEPVPLQATGTGRRTTPDLLGFGLLDAVPAWEILARADPSDRNGDGISGRPNFSADGRLGRFGRKAQEPTLREFNAGAFLFEMGITNPAKPKEETIGGNPLPAGVDPAPDAELNQQDFDAANAFVQLLAPPRRQPLSIGALKGYYEFAKIGCAACQVPALFTGYNRVSALSYKRVYAYTDLLLHDMGPALADICLGRATPSEFRTEPLMGLRFVQEFLHDGRAATIEEAISLHGGEAARSRDRYLRLSSPDRWALLEFLNRL